MGSNLADTSAQHWLRTRPDVDEALAASLALEHFGMTGAISELGSQQDRNFRIDPREGRGILLKVNHPSVTRQELAVLCAVSDRLRAEGVPTPEMLPTLTGARSIDVPVGGDGDGLAQGCAFELVAGSTLADEAELGGAVAEELGRTAGRVVRALAGLEHEGADRTIQWELGQALRVVELLIDDLPEERRVECLDAARRAAAQLDALAPDLPRQIIHGDLTADNVMRDDQGGLWVVDLGDASRSWRVAELAVLAADVLGRTGSVAQVGRAVRGFHAEAPLGDAELGALWPLVVLRGAVLAVSGWSQLRIDPGNTYARERLEHEWQVFARSASLPAAELEAQVRLAAGLPHRRNTEYAEAVAGLRLAAIVDLGVRSPALDRGRWLDPDIEAHLAREALTGAPVAAMRFGEARLSRVPAVIGASAATRARSVELWARPGTAVSAPFAGELHVDGGAAELADLGVTVRFDGLVAQPAGNRAVERGELIGRIAGDGPDALGRLRVTRRVLDAAGDAPFAAPGDEYEADGAADPSPVLGLEPVADPIAELERERRRRDRAMGGAAERYYADPPQLERGWGTRLIDTQGRAYLDMVNNVTAIGHSHPRLADAVGRQLHLLNTNSRFLYEAYAEFTEKLLSHSPDPSLDAVIPVNSGSEAVDLAIRLAQVATGRRDVIALREGYHGWTMASDAVSTSAFDNPQALSSRPDWVHLVDAPNAYRGPFRGEDSGPAYAAQVAELAGELRAHGRGAAAFICEPVLGNAGGVIPPKGFLREAYAAVRVEGGLAIADEVQVGYGRLGDAFWGSELQGVVPDIIAVAKAAGNAYPIGAVITRREIVEALQHEGMFFSSAAGAPASAVAGAAVLDVIRDEGLQENARRVGGHLRERLQALSLKHPLVGTVHGAGLYLGVELVRDRATLEPATEETAWVCERLLELGVIMQATSERQNVLKVKPPLTLSLEDADAFVAALDRALGEVALRS